MLAETVETKAPGPESGGLVCFESLSTSRSTNGQFSGGLVSTSSTNGHPDGEATLG